MEEIEVLKQARQNEKLNLRKHKMRKNVEKMEKIWKN